MLNGSAFDVDLYIKGGEEKHSEVGTEKEGQEPIERDGKPWT